ncbi:divergent polysaccharide deacetylase family protein [Belnapia sp. T18]|uniref:Divergent polysaccharide deacetylase family protein n=1 Tax=Belnapia arida TaxID=2804533 RepID=A0ABS1U9D7_9PROT|nr:divergent polysaccharide deacetylase family protein [Belnapia arida]MBL6081298.1 divergent polysaccharide deacetylase family protein [Belnapia arida]
MARLSSGWRALILCWAVVLLLIGGGTGVLAWLGPLPAPPVAEAPAAPPAAPSPPVAPAIAQAPPAPEPPPVIEAASRPGPAPGRPIPAGEEALQDSGPHGSMPRIGPDGRTSIRAFGRPFDRQESRPRIGLVIGGLGMNAALTEEAIRRLPGPVTLAFSPYAPQPGRLLDQARARGMEVLLALPLEPTGYPLNNPGNRALLTSLPAADNEDRLAWLLSRFSGYVGAIGALGPMRGERFAAMLGPYGDLQARIASRGLLYVDPRPGAPSPERAWGRSIDLVIDEPATRGEIELKLRTLEALARERGAALGYAGEASPVLIDRLAAWAGTVEASGLVLAPVTALMQRPAAR